MDICEFMIIRPLAYRHSGHPLFLLPVALTLDKGFKENMSLAKVTRIYVRLLDTEVGLLQRYWPQSNSLPQSKMFDGAAVEVSGETASSTSRFAYVCGIRRVFTSFHLETFLFVDVGA